MKNKFKRFLSLAMALVMVIGMLPHAILGASATEATSVEHTYTVAGDSGLCGAVWDTNYTANDMTLQSDGTYTKVFKNVPAGTYAYKVVEDHSWGNCWGGVNDSNAKAVVETAGSTVTISFKPYESYPTATVEVPAGECAHEYEYECSTHCMLCGQGERETTHCCDLPTFPEGKNCTTDCTVTYVCIDCGYSYEEEWYATEHEFIDGYCCVCREEDPAPECEHYEHNQDGFCTNCGEEVGHTYVDGVCQCGKTESTETVEVSFYTGEGSHVDSQTLNAGDTVLEPTVDPTREGYDFGGWYTDEACTEEFDFDTAVTSDLTLYAKWVLKSTDTGYALFGIINGAYYGCDEDAENIGEYIFVDGKLTVTFTSDSYVAVKTTDNATWYMTDGWAGDATSVTLYDSTLLHTTGDKLMVPGGVELTFTLVENADGTLTLSYSDGSEDEEPTEPAYETRTIYFQNNWLWSDVNIYFWNSETAENPAWPGFAMELAGNDGTYDIYKYEVPADVEAFLFNGLKDDGSGTRDQSPDITEGFYNGICYYMLWEDGNKVSSEDISVILPGTEVNPDPTPDPEPDPTEPTEPDPDAFFIYFDPNGVAYESLHVHIDSCAHILESGVRRSLQWDEELALWVSYDLSDLICNECEPTFEISTDANAQNVLVNGILEKGKTYVGPADPDAYIIYFDPNGVEYSAEEMGRHDLSMCKHADSYRAFVLTWDEEKGLWVSEDLNALGYICGCQVNIMIYRNYTDILVDEPLENGKTYVGPAPTEPEPADYVLQVGDEKFEASQLKDAFTAADNGGTVEVLKDFTLSEFAQVAYVDDVTLNLNGYTITLANALSIASSTVTINAENGGMAVTDINNYLDIGDKSNVVLNGGTYGAIHVNGTAELHGTHMEAGAFMAESTGKFYEGASLGQNAWTYYSMNGAFGGAATFILEEGCEWVAVGANYVLTKTAVAPTISADDVQKAFTVNAQADCDRIGGDYADFVQLGEVTENDGVYTCVVTIKAKDFAEYMSVDFDILYPECAPHSADPENPETIEVTLTWDAENQEWTAAEEDQHIYVYILCTDNSPQPSETITIYLNDYSPLYPEDDYHYCAPSEDYPLILNFCDEDGSSQKTYENGEQISEYIWKFVVDAADLEQYRKLSFDAKYGMGIIDCPEADGMILSHDGDEECFVWTRYADDTYPRPGGTTEPTEPVVDTEINTCEELIAAFSAGGEYTLGNDLILEEAVYVYADTVLDLNGKKITMTVMDSEEYSYGLISIGNSYAGCPACTLTLRNGTVEYVDDGTIDFQSGTLNLENGNYESVFIWANGNALLNITNSTVGELYVEEEYQGTARVNKDADSTITEMGVIAGTFNFDPSFGLYAGYTATESDGLWTVSFAGVQETGETYRIYLYNWYKGTRGGVAYDEPYFITEDGESATDIVLEFSDFEMVLPMTRSTDNSRVWYVDVDTAYKNAQVSFYSETYGGSTYIQKLPAKENQIYQPTENNWVDYDPSAFVEPETITIYFNDYRADYPEYDYHSIMRDKNDSVELELYDDLLQKVYENGEQLSEYVWKFVVDAADLEACTTLDFSTTSSGYATYMAACPEEDGMILSFDIDAEDYIWTRYADDIYPRPDGTTEPEGTIIVYFDSGDVDWTDVVAMYGLSMDEIPTVTEMNLLADGRWSVRIPADSKIIMFGGLVDGEPHDTDILEVKAGRTYYADGTFEDGTDGPVASIGDEMFDTLEAALEAAESGDVIKLLSDDCINETDIPEGAVLDLNGHKLILTETPFTGRISFNGGLIVPVDAPAMEMFGPNGRIMKTTDGIIDMSAQRMTLAGGTFTMGDSGVIFTLAGTAKLIVPDDHPHDVSCTLNSTDASIVGPADIDVVTERAGYEVVCANGTYTLALSDEAVKIYIGYSDEPVIPGLIATEGNYPYYVEVTAGEDLVLTMPEAKGIFVLEAYNAEDDSYTVTNSRVDGTVAMPWEVISDEGVEGLWLSHHPNKVTMNLNGGSLSDETLSWFFDYGGELAEDGKSTTEYYQTSSWILLEDAVEWSSFVKEGCTLTGFRLNGGTEIVDRCECVDGLVVDLVWEITKPEPFSFYGTNLNLGTDLDLKFAFAMDHVENWDGYYAEMIRTYGDGRDEHVVRVESEDWDVCGAYYVVAYEGFAAKEMCDIVYVTIYDPDGNAVSESRADCIQSYALRAFDDDPAVKTLVVDLLNYGTAAQVRFGYSTDDLANSVLTADHQQYASDLDEIYDVHDIDKTKVLGANLNIKSNICFRIAFKNITEGMYAKVEYTNHNRKLIEETHLFADMEKSVAGNGNVFHIVNIRSMVVADSACPVTVTMYNADGTVYTTYVDSIASYALRGMNDTEWGIFEEFVKFANSAWRYLHRNEL